MTVAIAVIAVVAVFIVIILAASIRILREYERGVIFRLGRLIAQKGPGLILLIPLVDRMVKVDLRTVTLNVPPQEVVGGWAHQLVERLLADQQSAALDWSVRALPGRASDADTFAVQPRDYAGGAEQALDLPGPGVGREVEVGREPAEQQVADRAADEVGPGDARHRVQQARAAGRGTAGRSGP